MIRIDKAPSPDELEKASCRNRVEENVQNREFKGSYYNAAPVLSSLETTLHNKCCFCESYIRPVDTPQVEHYRPKNTLKDEPAHIGYYWLGHEWPNLLLACPACNKAKTSLCPVQGARVSEPTLLPDGKLDRSACRPDLPPLSEEKIYLVNPEYENPEPFFRFKPDGSISSTKVRGKRSISICKLDRPDLNLARKTVLDDYRKMINLFFGGYEAGQITESGLQWLLSSFIQTLKNEITPREKYTLLRKQSFKRYEEFFVKQVEEARRPLLRQVFQEAQ